MLIKNKKPFALGIVFAISFLSVLALIFSPLFRGKNGLQFADNSFNRLSKGSSYFIPKVARLVDKVAGRHFSLKITLDKSEDAEAAAKLLTTAGAKVEPKDSELLIEADIGLLLQSALRDSDAMFKNEGKAVSARYGCDEKTAMKTWWTALSKIEKRLKKKKSVEEAKVVSEVIKKAVEPGYNFYMVDSEQVADHVGMMSGLLAFYVVYTMWWGYAIFHLFNGLGLSMKKAKVKKET
ncbi:MAG: hypothetical protein M1497_08245 [Nitrospirae bacterium]|nr:hypothetical protein [Nitrospirota bacterium]